MKDYNYSYTICDCYDSEIFMKQCKTFEEKIPGIKKIDSYVDVDGTEVCKYSIEGKEVVIKNDYQVGAVYVDSCVELTKYFK